MFHLSRLQRVYFNPCRSIDNGQASFSTTAVGEYLVFWGITSFTTMSLFFNALLQKRKVLKSYVNLFIASYLLVVVDSINYGLLVIYGIITLMGYWMPDSLHVYVCLEEKIQIMLYIDPVNLLNQRCDIIARCRHRNKFRQFWKIIE